MAGYWPRSFFACLWTELKDLLYQFTMNDDAQVTPSERDRSILSVQVANHNAGFASSCPCVLPEPYNKTLYNPEVKYTY